MDVASQQETLTLQGTCFRPPFEGLLMLQLLRPVQPNLRNLFSTFHLEYPSVLSLFRSSDCKEAFGIRLSQISLNVQLKLIEIVIFILKCSNSFFQTLTKMVKYF